MLGTDGDRPSRSGSSVDLYERLLSERDRDAAAFNRKYSPVMRATVEHYSRTRIRAIENAEVKAARGP